jgi:hypothetical protein
MCGRKYYIAVKWEWKLENITCQQLQKLTVNKVILIKEDATSISQFGSLY